MEQNSSPRIPHKLESEKRIGMKDEAEEDEERNLLCDGLPLRTLRFVFHRTFLPFTSDLMMKKTVNFKRFIVKSIYSISFLNE
jgi:hypothetical protein